MEIRNVKLHELQEWENNTRIHTRKNLEVIKGLLLKFGQTKPILVQKSSMRIIAGNGTFQAVRALGWEEISCRILDLNDEDAMALNIGDNRSSDLSENDERNILEYLKNADPGTIELVGFDEIEVEKMLRFHSPEAFEDIIPKEEKPLEKVSAEDFPTPLVEETNSTVLESPTTDEKVSYEDQLSFTVNGFVFSLSNPEEIEEIRCLTELLKDSSEKDRKEVNKAVFNSIKEILTEKFMR